MDVSARRDFTPPTHIGIIGMLDVGVMVTLNASLSWAAHIEPRPMVNTLEIGGTEGVALCRLSLDFRTMAMDLSAAPCASHIVPLLRDFVAAVNGQADAPPRPPFHPLRRSVSAHGTRLGQGIDQEMVRV